jgi:hypothetical protein|tara:strand:- start:50 stop:793 length:744 start_codon:yes stop_codon:yes gene_type:complete
MKNNLQFSRYEFKYFLKEEIADHIFKIALNFMNVDNYALKSGEKGYFVRSLYFDNSEYDNFFEKVDGMQVRKKFRIRTYEKSFNNKSNFFLEMKGRKQDRIIKKRTAISMEHLKYFYSPIEENILLTNYKKNTLVEDFIFDKIRKRINPRILVDYLRRPLVNKYGLYFRLTFDSNLITAKSNSLFAEEKFFFPKKFKPGCTILEVKFERSIPAWFHRIIQTYNLKRQSISKYVLGVCACGVKNETSD